MGISIDWEAVGGATATATQGLTETILTAIQKELESAQVSGGISEEQYNELLNKVAEHELETSKEFGRVVKRLDEFGTRLEKQASREVVVKRFTPSAKATLKEVAHYNFERLVRYVNSGVNVALIGEAGSGKTFGAEQVSRALKLSCYMMSFHAKMTPTDLRGYCDANGRYIESPIYKAYKNGGVLVLDEFDRSNTEVVVSLNNLLAGGSYTFPNAECVKKHKDFRVIACQNTTGHGASKLYRSASAQDASTLNRFCKIEWNIDEALELQIAGNNPITKAVQAIRANARNCGMTDLIISPRQSLDANTLCAAGDTLKDAVHATILCGLAEDKQERLLNGVTL